MSVEIDYIVLDFDGGDLLERCLESIRAQSLPPARIIIFDNGSQVPVTRRLKDRQDLVVLRSESNLGFTGGINAAMKQSFAPFVAWVNNDCELLAQWGRRLGEAMTPGAAAGQSIVVRPDGRIDGAGIEISRGRYLQSGYGASLDAPFPEPWGISATAALYRRAALDAVATPDGPLDDRFFAWYEDVELSARLRAAGWPMILVREPLAVHQGSLTASRLGAFAERLRIRNRYFVHRLHPATGSTPGLLLEDVRRLAGQLSRGQVHRAARSLAAVVAGIAGPIRRPDSSHRIV
jgi:N-acetylglucosaminyl-diphospho-decaprenol L-rhamnosyltransferase